MTTLFQSIWDLEQNTELGKTSTDLRKALQHSQTYLKQQFFDGVDIVELVHCRAHYVDQVLQALWQQSISDDKTLSLLAVGGYGRGELHPYSDVDILILLDQSIAEAPPESLSNFLTQLWDIGLEIGHSVRTVAECREQASDDISVATNLLETRLLAGNMPLYNELQALTTVHKSWDTARFYQEKRREQQQRHQKFNDSANNLEPNIKESPGGLRDIQIINWVALQHFNVSDLNGLHEKGFISNSEYTVLDDALRFLWRIRFALHIAAKRKQEKLMINFQRDLATQLGYEDCEKRLAVEHFMKDYYLCARAVGQMNELLLQLFEENIILADEPKEIMTINRRFQVHNGYLQTLNAGIFAYYPMAMLELFLILQEYPQIKGVRANTIRQLHAHIHLIDERFRNDIKHKALFMEIIRQPRGITDVFRRMNAFGVLGAYLPEFGQIVGQMQHDLFHAYTVDEHTLFLVRNLRRFSCPEYQDEFPLASHVFTELPKHELLYIAGLYHDIAKGRGGDHSILGMVDAEQFCQRHSLSQYDTELVTFLVRHHLSMSATAQKFDVQDPDVIKKFANTVESIDRLNYLYLITVADIRATNNNLWNGWRDSLLKQLYQNTKQWLEESEKLAQTAEDKALKVRQQAQNALITSWAESSIKDLWQEFENEYFARHTIENIVWQSQCLLESPNQKTIICARPITEHTLEVFVFTPDKPRLFAAMTSCFERLDLYILDAKITTTTKGNTLNSYIVNGQIQTPEDITAALAYSIENVEDINTSFVGLTPRTMKLFETKPNIQFHNNAKHNQTTVELTTHDRPGLLSRIARVFLECDIQVIDAKLITLGDQVEDNFYIRNSNNDVLTEEQQKTLQIKLVESLSAD